MNIRSALTQRTNAYRAGGELAAALRGGEPEVVLLFASIHYLSGYAMLHQGLLDGLGGRSPLVLGCTGDGVYERQGVANHGVCALGLNAGGEVKWSLAMRPRLSENVDALAMACAREAVAGVGGKASFALAFADGTRTDSTALVTALNRVLTCPYTGGIAADDRRFMHSQVFCGCEAEEDALVVLAASGNLSFALHAASGWLPVGRESVVEDCDGSTIRRIGGQPAFAFLREQLGVTPGALDIGIIPLAEYPPDSDGNPILHAPGHLDAQSGEITTVGGMPQGTRVRVCTASRDDVLRGVDNAIAGVQRAGLKPAGILIVSCAGRRWILEDRCREEIERLQAAFGPDLPVAGFPSFGEIGPFRTAAGNYTPVYVHNTTCVLCLIGE
jgi:hypothetical protein